MEGRQEQMLADAIARTRKLVADLERQQQELEAPPPQQLPPEQTELGRQAVANAIASARRLLEALEDAALTKKATRTES